MLQIGNLAAGVEASHLKKAFGIKRKLLDYYIEPDVEGTLVGYVEFAKTVSYLLTSSSIHTIY